MEEHLTARNPLLARFLLLVNVSCFEAVSADISQRINRAQSTTVPQKIQNVLLQLFDHALI